MYDGDDSVSGLNRIKTVVITITPNASRDIIYV